MGTQVEPGHWINQVHVNLKDGVVNFHDVPAAVWDAIPRRARGKTATARWKVVKLSKGVELTFFASTSA